MTLPYDQEGGVKWKTMLLSLIQKWFITKLQSYIPSIGIPQQTLNQGMIWIIEYYKNIQLYCHKIHPCNLLIYCFQNFYQKKFDKSFSRRLFFHFHSKWNILSSIWYLPINGGVLEIRWRRITNLRYFRNKLVYDRITESNYIIITNFAHSV